MFELIISTVLTDGSQRETALTWQSMMEFEAAHRCNLIVEHDKGFSLAHLTTLAWLAHKQVGSVPVESEFAKSLKGVSYRAEKIPFGETASTHS